MVFFRHAPICFLDLLKGSLLFKAEQSSGVVVEDLARERRVRLGIERRPRRDLLLRSDERVVGPEQCALGELPAHGVDELGFDPAR